MLVISLMRKNSSTTLFYPLIWLFLRMQISHIYFFLFEQFVLYTARIFLEYHTLKLSMMTLSGHMYDFLFCICDCFFEINMTLVLGVVNLHILSMKRFIRRCLINYPFYLPTDFFSICYTPPYVWLPGWWQILRVIILIVYCLCCRDPQSTCLHLALHEANLVW